MVRQMTSRRRHFGGVAFHCDGNLLLAGWCFLPLQFG